MIYKPAQILADLLTFMSLENGDVVMTGTPRGVGVIHAGDVFHGTVLDQGAPLTAAEWVAG
jgi:2-keto-4-pentenoate hydratase/2-oxohepta-3-ene-1,7-dioic acid hydratase in catechol pathway